MAKRRHRLDEEAVFAGPAASPMDIVRLIHAINPTDRELSAAERQERYERKSRLQSLLIRRFGEHLDVEPDPRDPDVVSLFLRAGRKDAAHARLSGLEEDARRWARLRLDERGLPEPAPPEIAWKEERGPSAAADPLAAGRAALAAYDYEEARRCFEAALLRPGQATPAGKALLKVLVESLGLDEDALALAPRLPDAVRADPAYRARLGLAAARLGRAAEARAFLEGAAGTASAWEALARRAAQRQDARELAECLRRIQQEDPAHPALLPLSEQLERLRARARQPAEEALQRRVDAQEWGAVEAEAEALLRQWPHSAVARNALGLLEASRQARQRAELLRQADAAEAAGRFETARSLLQQAAEAGAAVEDRLRALQQRIRQDEDQRQVQAVLAALARDRRAGLLAAAALPDRLLLSLAADNATLRPLADLGRPRGPAEVDALLALDRARAAMEAGDLAAADAVLAAQEGALRRLPEAQRLRKEAHAQLQARGDAALAALLAQAEADLAAGEADRAGERLQGAPTAGRDPALIRRLDALRRQAEGEREQRSALARFEALLAGGDAYGAREWAAAQPGPGWPERQAEAQRRLRADWRLTVMEGPFPDETLREFSFARHLRSPHFWLREGGEEVLLADPWDRWVILYRVRVADGRLLQRVVLQTPVPLKDPHVQALGGELWLWGEDWLLILSVDPWDIRVWRDIRPLTAGRGEKGTLRIPGTPYAWTWAAGRDGGRCRVIDLREWRTEQQLRPCEAVFPVVGADPPFVVRCLSPDGFDFHTPRGGRGPYARYGCPPVGGAAPHPGGSGLVALSVRTNLGPDRKFGISALSFHFDTSEANSLPLTGADVLRPCSVVTLPRERVSYAVYHRIGIDCELVRLTPGLRGLQIQGRESFHAAWCLVQSSDGLSAALLGCNEGHVLAQKLGAEVPRLPAPWRAPMPSLPSFSPPYPLMWEANVSHRAKPRFDALKPVTNRAAWLASREESLLATPEAAAEWGFAAAHLEEPELADGFLEKAGARYPDDAWVAIALGMRRSEQGRWEEAAGLLARAPLEQLPAGTRKQAIHLLGIALLSEGDPLGARAAWQEGQTEETDLETQDLMDYAEELALGRPLDGAGGTLNRYLRAIREADRRLAAGDHRGAVEALHEPLLWMIRDVQSAARRAAAWLAWEPADAEDRYWKLISLARLAALGSVTDRKAMVHIPLGPEAWGEERIQAIQREAEAWIAAPPSLDPAG